MMLIYREDKVNLTKLNEETIKKLANQNINFLRKKLTPGDLIALDKKELHRNISFLTFLRGMTCYKNITISKDDFLMYTGSFVTKTPTKLKNHILVQFFGKLTNHKNHKNFNLYYINPTSLSLYFKYGILIKVNE